MKALLASLIFASSFLMSCASVEPIVHKNSAPEDAFGYITGSFTRDGINAFAFILRNSETGKEYGMTLGEDSLRPAAGAEIVAAIKVPPGRYEITQWITYNGLTRERIMKNDVTNTTLKKPFYIGPGSIAFLGRFTLDTYTSSSMKISSGRTITSTIRPLPVTSKEAQSAFLKAYTSFGNKAFSCHLCSDTLAQ